MVVGENIMAALIVLGGTMLATLLRCGIADCAVMCRATLRALRGRFDSAGVRAILAGQVMEIRQDGLMRTNLRHFGDKEFDDATSALIGHRSLDALMDAHKAHRDRRMRRALTAARTLNQAADLAPVFGLAGTLISLGHLPADGINHGSYMAAIGMAVQATLWGLMVANLALAPLARLIERRAEQEENERQALVDWMAVQIAPVCHRPDEHPSDEATPHAATANPLLKITSLRGAA
ncbi:MAG: hypothetical protein RLY97_580 [Pseudomonadota bacterium]|jgi:chemotaxis protein MotA